MIGAALLALCILAMSAREALAHGGGLDRHGCHHETATGGYHCHRGNQDKGRKNDGNQPGDEDWSLCEVTRATAQREADAWNRREAAAWARLEKKCADETPISQFGCKFLGRLYLEEFSPEAAADFQKMLLDMIAAACAPPTIR